MTKQELMDAVAKDVAQYESDTGTIIGCYVQFFPPSHNSKTHEWDGEKFVLEPNITIAARKELVVDPKERCQCGHSYATHRDDGSCLNGSSELSIFEYCPCESFTPVVLLPLCDRQQDEEGKG